MKLRQGLDLSGTEDGSAAHMEDTVDSEISASIEVILQEPELVLQDPSTSQTGLALKGLLIAQVASRVSVCIVIPSHNSDRATF